LDIKKLLISFFKKENGVFIIFLSVLIIIYVSLLFTTADYIEHGNDCIHYYISKNAFNHPTLFLDLWGKPIYTLFTAPFAQFGFFGMKLFNTLIAISSAVLAFYLAKILKIKWPYISAIFLLLIPQYWVGVFGGLGEVLFIFVLYLALIFFYKKWYGLAAFFFSFLPFCRSEGVIVLFFFGLYYFFIKQLKFVPLFFCGLLIYYLSTLVAGFSIFVFLGAPYPSGVMVTNIINFLLVPQNLLQIFFLPKHFLIVLGPIILFFLVSGLFNVFLGFFKKKDLELLPPVLVFLFLSFFFFVLFYSNDFYERRYMMCLLPFIVLFSNRGYEFLVSSSSINKNFKYLLGVILVFVFFVFFYRYNQSGLVIGILFSFLLCSILINHNLFFRLQGKLILSLFFIFIVSFSFFVLGNNLDRSDGFWENNFRFKAVNYVVSYKLGGDLTNYSRVYYFAPEVVCYAGFDPFNNKYYENLVGLDSIPIKNSFIRDNVNVLSGRELVNNSLVIWDSTFGKNEGGVPLSFFDNGSEFVLLGCVNVLNEYQIEPSVCVFNYVKN